MEKQITVIEPTDESLKLFASKGDPNLKATGIKFAVERSDGAITTWHTCFDKPAEKILAEIKEAKGWYGGLIVYAYIEFLDSGNRYFKQNLELAPLQKALDCG